MEAFGASKDVMSQHLHFPNTVGIGVWGKGVRTLDAGWHTYWVRIRPVSNGIRFTLGVDKTTTGSYVLKNTSKIKNVNKSKAWDVAANIAVSSNRWTGNHKNAPKGSYSMKVAKVWWQK
jgi:hypothetical protein